jgi:hypothetical protein
MSAKHEESRGHQTKPRAMSAKREESRGHQTRQGAVRRVRGRPPRH